MARGPRKRSRKIPELRNQPQHSTTTSPGIPTGSLSLDPQAMLVCEPSIDTITQRHNALDVPEAQINDDADTKFGLHFISPRARIDEGFDELGTDNEEVTDTEDWNVEGLQESMLSVASREMDSSLDVEWLPTDFRKKRRRIGMRITSPHFKCV